MSRNVLTLWALGYSTRGEERDGKYKQKEEVDGWFRGGGTPKDYPVFCFVTKIHLQKDLRLCEASKKNGAYQAPSLQEERKAPAVRIQYFHHQ